MILFFFDKLKGKASVRTENLDLLGLKILNAFKTDVESRGSRFYVLSLPSSGDFRYQEDYFNFFKEAERIRPMIHPEPKLFEEARRTSIKSLFGQIHYSVKGNKIVADVVADYIIKELQKLKMADSAHDRVGI